MLYGLIGALSATLDFGVFTLLVRLFGIHYIIANCISIFTGIATSFTLNRNFNFKVKDHTSRRFIIFLTVGICGLMVSNTILYVSIDLIKMNSLVSKLLSIIVVAFLQFIANKHITFKNYSE